LAELYRRVGRPEAARPLLVEGVRRLRKTGIQDFLWDSLMALIAVSSDSDEINEMLVEASALANRIGSNAKLLDVARAQFHWASSRGDNEASILALEEMFRFTQSSQSILERQRSLRSLITELDRHNCLEYSNAVRAGLGETVEGPVQLGWKELLSSDSHAAVCVLAVGMAKEALQTSP